MSYIELVVEPVFLARQGPSSKNYALGLPWWLSG